MDRSAFTISFIGVLDDIDFYRKLRAAQTQFKLPSGGVNMPSPELNFDNDCGFRTHPDDGDVCLRDAHQRAACVAEELP